MLRLGSDLAINVPEVGEAHSLTPRRWDAIPQALADSLALVAYGISDDLASAPAQDQPDPLLVLTPAGERPEFVKLQTVLRRRQDQRLPERWRRPGFF